MDNSTEALVLQLEAIRLEMRAAFACLILAVGTLKGVAGSSLEEAVKIVVLQREGDLLSDKAQRISRGDLLSDKAQRISRGEWSPGKPKEEK